MGQETAAGRRSAKATADPAAFRPAQKGDATTGSLPRRRAAAQAGGQGQDEGDQGSEGFQSRDFRGEEARPGRLRPWFVSLQPSERFGNRLVGDAEVLAD